MSIKSEQEIRKEIQRLQRRIDYWKRKASECNSVDARDHLEYVIKYKGAQRALYWILGEVNRIDGGGFI